MNTPGIVIIGAGVGGLTAGALLARQGYAVTVLEAQVYAGGSAGTFFHKGYRFDAGATVAGGFQPGGPHALIADQLGIRWPVRQHDPAWVVHSPAFELPLTQTSDEVVERFPQTKPFWAEQADLAELGWALSGACLPWPPGDLHELLRLAQIGLRFFPHDLKLAPFALSTTADWLRRRGLHTDDAFVRFIDAQLLISAQTTSRGANAAYAATALDLARQGVYHVEGGMGGISDALIASIRQSGGQVFFRKRVERIEVSDGRASAVLTDRGERFEADFVLANLTPWALDQVLAEASPKRLKDEISRRLPGWGAFVLHLGIDEQIWPADFPDHHQFLDTIDGPLGETHSVFLSASPAWDSTRAPAGRRAVTVSTHTDVRSWAQTAALGEQAYAERKAAYTESMLALIERTIPGFREHIVFQMSGSPTTYAFYTGRPLGMVGGFPQTNLFRARGSRTGIRNLRLVGDSIFPGQSTAGVSLGAMRVVADVMRQVPGPARSISLPAKQPLEIK